MTDSGEQMQKTAATESGAQQHRGQARITAQTGPLERRTVPVRRIVGKGAVGGSGAEDAYAVNRRNQDLTPRDGELPPPGGAAVRGTGGTAEEAVPPKQNARKFSAGSSDII